MPAMSSSKKLLLLSGPMILSNISTPLLGMVDTAVVGHMGSVGMMAGAAIGTLVISQLYWLCGFLRMATTGTSAQAYGQGALESKRKSLVQGMFVAFLLGSALVICSPLIMQLGYWFAQPHPDIFTFVEQYISVRLWGAPFAVLNLILLGWLIGQQKTRVVLVVTVLANIINALLNLILVFGFDLGIRGLASATVFAELTITASCIGYIIRQMNGISVRTKWLKLSGLRHYLALNRAIFLRNLFLQCTLAFMTFQAARLGQEVVAVNTILMQFFVLTALGLDGIAQGVEALVGQSKGQKNAHQLLIHVRDGVIWSSLMALLYSLFFYLGHPYVIALLTDLPEVISLTLTYAWVIWLLPIIGHWCFVFDGVFVALTRGQAMQNSMFISTCCCFFPVWWSFKEMGNTALWLALLGFLLARGVTLGGYFHFLKHHQRLLD